MAAHLGQLPLNGLQWVGGAGWKDALLLGMLVTFLFAAVGAPVVRWAGVRFAQQRA